MLAKVSELNKNVIILLSVVILAITSIVITLMVVGGSGNSSADSLEEFQNAFISEYGVKPNIDIRVHGASEAQAQTITETMAKKLKLNDPSREEMEGTTWYKTQDETGDVNVSAFYE